MIEPLNLQTKKNEYDEDIFPFEDIFAVYNKELSPSATERAMSQWHDFLNGTDKFLPVQILNTLVLLEDKIEKETPNSYGKLLDYIFKMYYEDQIDDVRIIKKLFFKLHPLWSDNKYFDKLLTLKTLIKTKKFNDPLISKWEEYTSYLFERKSPETLAKYYCGSRMNDWRNNQRDQTVFLSFMTIIDSFCKFLYEQPLVTVERKYAVFLIRFFAELLLCADPDLIINNNFTKDYIFNPAVIKYDPLEQKTKQGNYIIKQTFSLFKEKFAKLKQPLYPLYKKQLLHKYLPYLKEKEFNAKLLNDLEAIITEIYNLYPINYNNAPKEKLPEYAFIKDVMTSLINTGIPALSLSKKFTEDLRLREDYPAHDKILGEIIKENNALWKQNIKPLKEQYLQVVFDKYIPKNLSDFIWDKNFFHTLEQIRTQFYKDNFDKTNQKIYLEFLVLLLKDILNKADTSVALLPCENFLQDIRLNMPEIKNPVLKSVIQKRNYNKFAVLLAYIEKFKNEGLFKTVNNLADRLYSTILPQYLPNFAKNTEETANKAFLLLKQYDNRRKVNTFFNTKRDDRRDFWTITLEEFFDMDIALFGSYFCMIRLHNNMFLESAVYTHNCYVYKDFFNKEFTFSAVSRHLQAVVQRIGAAEPEKIIAELKEYTDKDYNDTVIHTTDWQLKMDPFMKVEQEQEQNKEVTL